MKELALELFDYHILGNDKLLKHTAELSAENQEQTKRILTPDELLFLIR
ncbi:hypothetical protein [Domibacillus aminovorans]|nr:hypothetical protein [Domibacillus aminovorans]